MGLSGGSDLQNRTLFFLSPFFLSQESCGSIIAVRETEERGKMGQSNVVCSV